VFCYFDVELLGNDDENYINDISIAFRYEMRLRECGLKTLVTRRL